MQDRWTVTAGKWSSTPDPARWEHTVANGTYDVTVTVGDSANADGSHTVNVEGVNAVRAFAPTTTKRHATAKVRVAVQDGRLTLDAVGGSNTKLNAVEISPVAPPPTPTTTTPPVTTPPVTTPPVTAPPVTTPPVTTPPVTTPPVTTAPVKVTAKGDVATAQRRLVQDPNVLWVGTGDENGWTTAWGQTGAGQLNNTTLATAPTGGNGKAIRIANAGGGTKGDRWGYDGRFGFAAAGIPAQDEAYLSYRIWFPADYEFDTQGKLPGLQGVVPGGSPWLANNSITCTSGPYKGKDCHDDRQFGARTMWKNGGMITYLNVVAIGTKDHDAQRTASGDNYSFSTKYTNANGADLKLRPGWNTIEQHVKLNTPGQSNGTFEGWINGERGVRLTNVQYRTAARADLRITQWNLAHFWGGPPTDYPTKATAVYYDDIAISRAPIGAAS
jgi:hypothetical protein